MNFNNQKKIENILIIEHSAIDKPTVKDQLSLLSPSSKIHCTNLLDEAITYIDECPPQLVMIYLKEIDNQGLEFCNSVKTQTGSTTTFLVLTHRSTGEMESKIKTAGFDGILTLPLNKTSLPSQLKNSLFEKTSETSASSSLDLDLTYLNKLAGDDIEFKLRVIEKLINQTNEIIEQIKINLEENQWDNVAKLLHKLAGSTGNVAPVEIKQKILFAEKLVEQGFKPNEFEEAINEVYFLSHQLILRLEEEDKTTKINLNK